MAAVRGLKPIEFHCVNINKIIRDGNKKKCLELLHVCPDS